jgi:predicted O-methyltransferase YrrM
MSQIPVYNVQQYFNMYGRTFKLVHFDLPEPNYENGNISFFETVVICLLCRNNKFESILEFGTFNGRTTINIAANISEIGNILTVDLPKGDINNTKFPLEGINEKDKHDELGYVGKTNKLYHRHPLKLKGKIRQLWMDTAQFPVNQYKEAFDFIFIDASHTYANVLNDSYNVLKCIKENGFILWHDYNGWPGVTQALNEVYESSKDKFNFAQIEGTSLVIYHACRA